jgi:hypothetical protein
LVESAEFWSGGAPAEYADANQAACWRCAAVAPRHLQSMCAVGLSYMSGQLRGAIGGPRLGGVVSLRAFLPGQSSCRCSERTAGGSFRRSHDAFVRGRWQPARGHLVTVWFLHAGDGMALPRPEISIGDLDFLSTDECAERSSDCGSSRARTTASSCTTTSSSEPWMWRAVFGDRTSLETHARRRTAAIPLRVDSATITNRSPSTALDHDPAPGSHLARHSNLRIKTGWLGFRDDTGGTSSAYAGILTRCAKAIPASTCSISRNATKSTRRAGANRWRCTCRTIGRVDPRF